MALLSAFWYATAMSAGARKEVFESSIGGSTEKSAI